MYIGLGHAHYGLSKQSEFKQALEYYQTASEIAKINAFKQEEATTLLRLGELCNKSIPKCADAINYFERGLAISQEMGNQDLECKMCLALGDAYHNLHQSNQCAKFSKHALDIAAILGDSKLTADSYLCLGNSYSLLYERENAQKSIELYEKAIDIYEKVEDEECLASCYINLSLAYQNQEKFHDAIHFQAKSLSIATKIGDKTMQSHSLCCLGNIYQTALKNNEKAYETFKKGLTLAKEISNKYLEHVCYGHLGGIYSSLKNYKLFQCI